MTDTTNIAEAGVITPADIVKIRNARNWKRSNLASYLGCNYTTVWRMENGKISIDGAHQRLLQQLQLGAVAA
ncbi:helix-turn-helix transcriptional regulator [Mesorhizobium sp. M0870]|uniref:helix-turn-helix transcriptional regulator n=1 Tax=Mesorhizobium sp. M0870 TaxID=2957016 RepID=UPI003338C3A9